MDGHGYDGESRGPQHHDRLRRTPSDRCEFCEKLGMSGMPEAGAIEYIFCDRIGDDGTGPPSGCILDGLTD